MSKNKRVSGAGVRRCFVRLMKTASVLTLAAACMAQSAPVCAISADAQELGFVTATVERGNLVVKVEANVTPEFHEREAIVFESDYGSTTFVRYLVERYEVVEEGQPIAEIYTKLDEITLEEQRIRNERSMAECEAFYKSYDEQLKQAEDAVRNAADETEKKLAKLRLEQRRMELDRSKKSIDERVEAMEKQEAANQQATEMTQIFAPCSGSIGWLNWYRPGETLRNGTVLGEIYVMEHPIYTVQDITGILRYGMELTIVDKQGTEYPAKIVSCNKNTLSKEFATEVAYIQADIPLMQIGNLTARYDTIHMENVLKVDAKAVKNDTNGNYVMELSEGKLIKHYFLAGRNISGMIHVVDGLEEGTVVVIN